MRSRAWFSWRTPIAISIDYNDNYFYFGRLVSSKSFASALIESMSNCTA